LLVVLTNHKEDPNSTSSRACLRSEPAFLAAVLVAMLEGTRFNEFAYWRGVEAKVASTLPQPAVVAETPAPLPTAKHAEPAQ
jgi:hypothetical protein